MMIGPNPSEGPFQLTSTPDAKHGKKPQYFMATQMALAHNMQIRSLNAIYIQATSVTSPKDIADFLVYCQCWYEMLHHHHQTEENFFFPALEDKLNKPGIMDVSLEQHKAFHDKLEIWAKKCYETTPEQYDGTEWRRLIDDFAEPLLKHLHDEIEALVALAPYDPDCVVMNKLWKETEVKGRDESDKYRIMPFCLGAADATFEGGTHDFPGVPSWMIYILNMVFARKHRSVWRFSPSDMYGQPRPLHFVSGNSQ